MTLDDLTIFWLHSDNFWLHFDYIMTTLWLFQTMGGGLVITNFWSNVLDYHWSKKMYRLQMIVDVRCYIHLRWSCSHFKISGSPQALRPATIYKLCLMWAGVGLFLLSPGRAGPGCAYTGDGGRWGQFGEEPSSKATLPTLPHTF